jgi:hypothetical protein
VNHYGPLERQKGGKHTGVWDYCCSNRHGGAYPVGYCAGWSERTKEQFEKDFPGHGEVFFKDQERRRPFKEKYHTDGHKTREEAIECYRQYEIDTRSGVGSTGKTHQPCLECGELTNRVLTIRGLRSYRICAKHDDHKALLRHHRGGTMVSSY